MSHFECPLDPFTCENSMFFEGYDKRRGKVARWVECVPHGENRQPHTHLQKPSSSLGGPVCAKNPPDWWELYKHGKRVGEGRGGKQEVAGALNAYNDATGPDKAPEYEEG